MELTAVENFYWYRYFSLYVGVAFLKISMNIKNVQKGRALNEYGK
jgi:hypothetical protein